MNSSNNFDEHDENKKINDILTKLPMSFPAKLTLRNEYFNSHSIYELVKIILKKPITIFTANQIKSVQILMTYLTDSEQNLIKSFDEYKYIL